jgi:PIN domain nuclease of toxin-antitoxin system
MKLLLDTHTFIWWDSDPAKLSPQTLALCQDQANVVLLSVVACGKCKSSGNWENYNSVCPLLR